MEQSSPQDSNATSWGERWTFVRSLESGNQGLALEAVDAAGVRAFIKVLPKKTSKERRARFSREVRILGDLAIPGIPRLIESNAAHAADKSYELFLAAEFIVGRRLHEVVSEGISGSAAVDLTLKIVRIVKAAHAVDVLHRDIKPDNVVIREDAGVLTPFLVDFGMAHIDEPDGFATHNSQEVGNRFMRLPEYNSGFDNKQDPRSDYTFCVGLLFFMLTKTNPSALLDESNNPPHQRRVERLLLRESGLDEDRLLRFFDIGFQNDITKRFQTPEDLIAGLEGLLTTQPADPIDAEAIAAKLRNRFMTPARQSQRDAAVTAQARLQEGEVALKLVLREFGSVLSVSQTNAQTTPNGASAEFFLVDPVNHLKRFDLAIAVEAIGTEQILSFTDGSGAKMEARVQIGFAMTDEQKAQLREFLLVGIDKATSDDRFYAPRDLEPSPYHPAIHLGPFNKLFEEEATFEFRPAFRIDWFWPRMNDGQLTIAWELTNVGSGVAYDVCVFLPNIASYREADMPIGCERLNERQYDQVSAYHDFTNPPVHVIVGCKDMRGNVYRQDGDVIAFPAYNGLAADYLTTQLGYPFLVAAHGVVPDDGVDRFHQTKPWRTTLIPET